MPHVLGSDPGSQTYLLSDLGDTTLFSLLPHGCQASSFAPPIMSLYKQVIEWLPVFQIDTVKKINIDICYPRDSFDRQSLQWDLNYFKYYFLKPSGIPFDEQHLEDDFDCFISHLLQTPADYFMYRDLQSRNIMILNNLPHFIDYQGGRKGPLAYDIASLLYDAKANIPFPQRQELLTHYMDALEERITLDREAFQRVFYDFVFIRILQALGTYGYRGGIEKKGLFLESLPFALKNLAWLDKQDLLPKSTPCIASLIRQLLRRQPAEILPPPDHPEALRINIYSFSYKRGIPVDQSGHGGGFVFDCRSLPNPGRQSRFHHLSGKDEEVQKFLKHEDRVGQFLDQVFGMINPVIEAYHERSFKSLTVCFGCTGGQHRSVYCAEILAKHLQQQQNLDVQLVHTEEGRWS